MEWKLQYVNIYALIYLLIFVEEAGVRSPHDAASHGVSDTTGSSIRNATQRYIADDLNTLAGRLF